MKVLSLIAVVLATIAAWVLITPPALALPDNVSNSSHNFSGNGGKSSYQYVGEFNEVCKYCHTPHNAGNSRLLWNKANMTGINAPSYRLYTSSKSLTSVTRYNSSLDANSPSLLCLGCHDGKTAMNVLHSSSTGVDAGGDYPAGTKLINHQGSYDPLPLDDNPGGFGIDPQGLNLGKATGAAGDDRTGDNLTNDHPIGFNYDLAQQEKPAALYPIVSVNPKIKFSGPSTKVECTTCHNPHADYDDDAVRPFLVMSNTGSALCLSCHNK